MYFLATMHCCGFTTLRHTLSWTTFKLMPNFTFLVQIVDHGEGLRHGSDEVLSTWQ